MGRRDSFEDKLGDAMANAVAAVIVAYADDVLLKLGPMLVDAAGRGLANLLRALSTEDEPELSLGQEEIRELAVESLMESFGPKVPNYARRTLADLLLLNSKGKT